MKLNIITVYFRHYVQLQLILKLDEWKKKTVSLCNETEEQHDVRPNEDKQLNDLTQSVRTLS